MIGAARSSLGNNKLRSPSRVGYLPVKVSDLATVDKLPADLWNVSGKDTLIRAWRDMHHLASGGWLFGTAVAVYALFEVCLVSAQWATFQFGLLAILRQSAVVALLWFLFMLLAARHRIRKERTTQWKEEQTKILIEGHVHAKLDSILERLGKHKEPNIFIHAQQFDSFDAAGVPSGPFNLLSLQYSPIKSQYFFGVQTVKSPPVRDRPLDNIIRYEIINYGPEAIRSVGIGIQASFFAAIIRKSGSVTNSKAGPLLREVTVGVPIPLLDIERLNSFVFYAINTRPHWIGLTFPKTLTAKTLSGESVEIPIHDNFHPSLTLTLRPFQIEDSKSLQTLYEGVTFADQTVCLDCSTWNRCVFENCVLISTGGPIASTGCTFSNCIPEFSGASPHRQTQLMKHCMGKPKLPFLVLNEKIAN